MPHQSKLRRPSTTKDKSIIYTSLPEGSSTAASTVELSEARSLLLDTQKSIIEYWALFATDAEKAKFEKESKDKTHFSIKELHGFIEKIHTGIANLTAKVMDLEASLKPSYKDPRDAKIAELEKRIKLETRRADMAEGSAVAAMRHRDQARAMLEEQRAHFDNAFEHQKQQFDSAYMDLN